MKLNRLTAACGGLIALSTIQPTLASSFAKDTAFLQKHTQLIVLASEDGSAKVAVAPAWQGRVMTSSANGENGLSFGWINRKLIASGKLQPHINVFGGEDRFWLGPEGGQFALFFAKGTHFDLGNWYTPAALDTMPYPVVSQSGESVRFATEFALTNYSGTRFDIGVDRVVRVLEPAAAWKDLGLKPIGGVKLVAFESENKITNKGHEPWQKRTGCLSIWILGQFNPSPGTVIVAPIRSGPESELGTKVTSDYFGDIPPDRLAVKDKAVYLKADGAYRSKIGISPLRSRKVLGSYDPDHHVLTIMQFTQPDGTTDYVNSLWKLQAHPYHGDVANSYNDGPPSPGAKPLGPFYELESSSPAAALPPGGSLTHIHRTVHLIGRPGSLDRVARSVLGVSLKDITSAFTR